MTKITCPHCDHKSFRTESGLAWHLEHVHGAKSQDKSRTIDQESPDKFALRQQLDEYEVDYLHYMTPFENCQSIFDNGILSFNHAKRIEHIDLASSSVQKQRGKIMISGSDKLLHDYVPLYFATHTPMQYDLTQGNQKKAPIMNQENLVFIDLDTFQILRIPGILYTDGNAAADATTFYCTPVDFSVLDWGVIRERKSFSKEHRRKKAAEVLAPDCVPIKCFSRIVVYNDDVAERLKRETNVTVLRLKVMVNPSYYY